MPFIVTCVSNIYINQYLTSCWGTNIMMVLMGVLCFHLTGARWGNAALNWSFPRTDSLWKVWNEDRHKEVTRFIPIYFTFIINTNNHCGKFLTWQQLRNSQANSKWNLTHKYTQYNVIYFSIMKYNRLWQ